ncbi:MAG: amidohydrolase family protein [Rhodospirillaceae bacterium]|jgi:cytosine/creatinine deaminase|nr:amidohydrolase family protein [Rhodospirillaceae bacterium]MBT8002519.1 amidohydrolase family protein [Rhodospirillales bacterium]MBT4700147.1 amidohydrolase family protein [Rhodospirillaceae bacterium]MBT5032976.1 amidohydrolase family protein [Rhodospirillaceae bacterium]MBT6219755.1 amidohydrolase family protein [Rhodospirillaceae bacterium]
MSYLLLRNVRLMGGAPVDVCVEDGIITEIAKTIEAPPETKIEDGKGQLLVPGFVDAHMHLDKTFWGLPWRPHQAGPLTIDRIENERRLRREEDVSSEDQAIKLMRQAIAKGTTHIRSHVDIDTEISLANLEGTLAARDRMKDHVTVQLVAFPQSGMLVNPGAADLLDLAITAGADLVGGIDPSIIERDPAGHIDGIFAIADRHGCGIDIHLHEPGNLGGFAIELIADRTRALGLQGKVNISHAFCLGLVDQPYFEKLAGLLADNEISIMTHAPGYIAFPPIKPLREAGVVLCSGSDNVRDAWGPYGNADMLERAMLLGYRSNFRLDQDIETALDITTFGGAAVMGAESYGLEVGNQADFVVVPGETLAEAVVNRPPRTLVVKGGVVVARDGNCLV